MTEIMKEHINYWINQKRLYDDNIKNNIGDIPSMKKLIEHIDRRIGNYIIMLEQKKQTDDKKFVVI